MKLFDIGFVIGRIISDGVMTFLALLFAWYVRMVWFDTFFFSWIGLGVPTTFYPLEGYITLALKVVVVLLVIFGLSGRYRFEVDEKVSDEMGKVVLAYTLGFAVLVVLFYFSQLFFFSRAIFGIAWAVGLFFVLGGRGILRWKRRWLYRGGFGQKTLLILGSTDGHKEVWEYVLKNPKYNIVGVLSEKKSTKKTTHSLPILGTFKKFENVLEELKPDEVLLMSDHSSDSLDAQLVKLAHIHHVKFRFLPDELGLDLAAVEVSTLGKSPLITLLNTKITGWGSVVKALFDHTASLVALVLLSPVFLVCAVMVLCESPRAPIFYRSKRVGKNGKLFSCYKFRSMVPDAEEQKKALLKKNQRKGGVLFKIEDDPRITRLGKFLRKWSLDELPQLLNVLKGDMSLIGPRPHLPEEVEKYNKDDLRVLSVRPGITGFAQINGRSDLSYEDEMRYELFYLKNWSLWLDFVIVVKSVWVVLTRKGAS